MVEIELTERSLVLNMRGINRFLALRQRVECALTDVRSVTVGIPIELRELPFCATRKIGTRLILGSTRIIIGSFGTLSDGDYFYAINSGERAITIALDHGHQTAFNALVIEVADPAGMAHAIGAAAERAKAAVGGVA